jgi:hypothetical protein
MANAGLLADIGKPPLFFSRIDYLLTPVNNGAWTEVTSSLSAPATEIEIFDSSGLTLELGFGAAASEVPQMLIFPGGNGRVPLRIPQGTRVSFRPITGDAAAGEQDINFYG